METRLPRQHRARLKGSRFRGTRLERWSVLASSAGAIMVASCGGGGAIRLAPPSPVDQPATDVIHTRVLEHVFARPDLFQPEDMIGAICVGMGETGSDIPSVEVLTPFFGVKPPVVAATLCTRSSEDYAEVVIRSTGGEPALLISLIDLIGNESRVTVTARVEKTGMEPWTFRCDVRWLGPDPVTILGDPTPYDPNAGDGWQVQDCY